MKADNLNPSALYWAQFNSLQFRIPGEAVEDIACSGANDAAVAHWAPKVTELTAELFASEPANPWNPTPDRIRAELKGYGAWDAEELADDEANWLRLVWLGAWNIMEDAERDCAEPVK